MFVNINASKITASWFEQEKLGILMGIFGFCGQLPGAFATATTAVLFDSRTSAFIVSAIFCISVFVLWLLFVKDKPEDTMEEREKIDQENQPSIGDSLKVVLSNKGVWLDFYLHYDGSWQYGNFIHFYADGIADQYGIDMKVCGTIASMLTLGNCIGSITGPIVFSKIKNVKVFVSGAAVLSFAGIIMCWRFPSIFVLHILVLYTGIMLGASMPIFLSAPVLLEGLGTKYAGSAAGVISTLQLLGAVLIPTYILTPIAGENYSLLFMLASICMVIMFLCGLLLPQFGNNQK